MRPNLLAGRTVCNQLDPWPALWELELISGGGGIQSWREHCMGVGVAPRIPSRSTTVLHYGFKLLEHVVRRYGLVLLGVMVVLGGIFLLVETLGVPVLSDPSRWLSGGGTGAAVLGTGLLVADVALPVPSSAVMVAYGALYGVAFGTLLSLVGSVGAALAGWALGRHGGRWLSRLVPAKSQAEAQRWIARWGLLAVTLSRPVPLLAESVAILAGTSALPWWQVGLAAALGSLPAAVLYAVTGAFAVTGSWFWLPGLLLVSTGVMWLIGRTLGRRLGTSTR
ncbi:hypothetical protein GCM10008949_23340 [Deinococcus humi]|nr:hypothetical protein GCM10008949_23340 [Deinococcus humi]